MEHPQCRRRVRHYGGPAISAVGAAYGHLLLLGPAMAGYFTTPTTMPGAMVEPLFLTDPFEANIAASPQGQQSIAAGITSALVNYLNVPS